MRLIFLGTGGYFPNDHRQTACLMIPELGIVLDAGSALFRVAGHLVTRQLDLFLSHAHMDHVIGLTQLHEIVQLDSIDRVTVHGDAVKLAAIEEHLFSEYLFPVQPTFELRPIAKSVALAGGGQLTHFPLVHPGGSLGYRLDWPDRTLAYVTDTTAGDPCGYEEHIRGVDVLVHECFLPDGSENWAKTTGHSTTSEVARLAKRAKVGRLILVHINPQAPGDEPVELDKARAIFGAIEVGRDQMEIEF